MITGANAGIGKATAVTLARTGATVLLVCRDRRRGEQAQTEITRKSGNPRVDLFLADLSSQRQIRQLARDVLRGHDRLDALINNAGLFLARRQETEDGLEMTFAVNHLAPFLLTHLLLPVLEASRGRVVTVSSEAHRRGTIDFADLNAERRYNWIDAYAQSKLANVLFTYELARHLDGTGVTATCLHPGVVATKIWNRNKTPFHLFLRLFTVFYMRPAWSASAVVRLAAAPELDGVTSKYFNKKKEMRSSKESYAEHVAERLWDVSATLTGIST